MPRIVKKGLKVGWSDCHGTLLNKHDTIEIKKGWRPEGYRCPIQLDPDIDKDFDRGFRLGYETGFDACLEAMEKI